MSVPHHNLTFANVRSVYCSLSANPLLSMIEDMTTHSIPLHRVLGRHTAELAGRGGGVYSIIEPVRVRGGTPEHLALQLEVRVEAVGGRYRRRHSRGRRRDACRRDRSRRDRGLGSRRGRGWRRRCGGRRQALRVVGVEDRANRAGVADRGSGVVDATTCKFPSQVRLPSEAPEEERRRTLAPDGDRIGGAREQGGERDERSEGPHLFLFLEPVSTSSGEPHPRSFPLHIIPPPTPRQASKSSAHTLHRAERVSLARHTL